MGRDVGNVQEVTSATTLATMAMYGRGASDVLVHQYRVCRMYYGKGRAGHPRSNKSTHFRVFGGGGGDDDCGGVSERFSSIC